MIRIALTMAICVGTTEAQLVKFNGWVSKPTLPPQPEALDAEPWITQ